MARTGNKMDLLQGAEMDLIRKLHKDIRDQLETVHSDAPDTLLRSVIRSEIRNTYVDEIVKSLATGDFGRVSELSVQSQNQVITDIYTLLQIQKVIENVRKSLSILESKEKLLYSLLKLQKERVTKALPSSTLSSNNQKIVKEALKQIPSDGKSTRALTNKYNHHDALLNEKMSNALVNLGFVNLARAVCTFRVDYSRKRKKFSDAKKLNAIVETRYAELEHFYEQLRVALISNEKRQLSRFLELAHEDRILNPNRHIALLIGLDRFILSRNGNPNATHKRISVELTNLIKETLLLRIAVTYLRWLQNQQNTTRRFNALAGRKAETLKLSVPRIPSNCKINFSSSKVNRLRIGTRYSVEGEIKSITITERSGKSISVIQIQDPAGNIIPAVLEYIKVDSGGLSEGNYVVVTGDLEIFQNARTIRIDRLSYAEQKEKNWYWRLRYLVDPVYTPYSHNLNMYFNWLPRDGGAEKQLVFGTYI